MVENRGVQESREVVEINVVVGAEAGIFAANVLCGQCAKTATAGEVSRAMKPVCVRIVRDEVDAILIE